MQESLEKYIRSPEKFFDSPPDVLRNPELTIKEKQLLLASWKNDLLEQQRANEENMERQRERPVTPSAERLQEVLEAIRVLEGRPNR